MACCPAVEGALKYLDMFRTVAKERYIRKLRCLYGGPGVAISMDELLRSLVMASGLMMLVNGLQLNLAIYICSYFVETLGGYTMEAMKAYKRLEGYNYYCLVFHSGWVRTVHVYYHDLGDGKHSL